MLIINFKWSLYVSLSRPSTLGSGLPVSRKKGKGVSRITSGLNTAKYNCPVLEGGRGNGDAFQRGITVTQHRPIHTTTNCVLDGRCAPRSGSGKSKRTLNRHELCSLLFSMVFLHAFCTVLLLQPYFIGQNTFYTPLKLCLMI